jgi:hypothetical protein
MERSRQNRRLSSFNLSFLKNISYIAILNSKMKDDKYDNIRGLSNHKTDIPKSKLKGGSTQDLFPIILDDGKTIIFISDKTKEKETIEKYKNRGIVRT